LALLGGGNAANMMEGRPKVNPLTGERTRPPDKIANTADLYLETLKLDSSTRARAYQRGDYDTSNRVMADPRIGQLKDSLLPYFHHQTESRKLNDPQDLTTVPEELRPYVESERQRWREGENVSTGGAIDTTYTGVSYKNKLALMRKNKNNNNMNQQPPPQ
jgi:hypothetical protein